MEDASDMDTVLAYCEEESAGVSEQRVQEGYRYGVGFI